MRLEVELSEMPPEFAVEREKETAVISFYTDVQKENGDFYRATMWRMRVPWQENLRDRIAANPGLWLDRVRHDTEKEEARDAKAREKADALDGIADTANALSIAFVTMAESGAIDAVTAGEHLGVFEAWQPQIGYKAGNLRKYGGRLYRCVQAHTSQADWTPDAAASLWAIASDPTAEYPDWSQPIGAHDAYGRGDKVAHNGSRWTSDVDGNVWEPGAQGTESLWHVVE